MMFATISHCSTNSRERNTVGGGRLHSVVQLAWESPYTERCYIETTERSSGSDIRKQLEKIHLHLENLNIYLCNQGILNK
jgi:hypothetical protein